MIKLSKIEVVGRIIIPFLLAIISAGILILAKGEKTSFLSPIPKFFGSSDKAIINNWFPKTDSRQTPNLGLTISAKSALMVDYDTANVIFAKNPQERLPVASTIKIMTALIALENGKLSDIYPISEKAAKIGENNMGLQAGEKLTLKELLYGLMLVSGNDAAVTIAEGVAGNETEFVKMMNEKAKSLGLKNSQFINATGLEEDGKNQYATAYDLAVIARYTWENYPIFRQITSTYHYYIEANANHGTFDLYNDTNLLTTYPGVKGIKPGFTWEAGLCLVTYAENGGKQLIGVILGSDNRRGEMKELLDYGFASFGIRVEHPDLD